MKVFQELVDFLKQWRFIKTREMDKLNSRTGIPPSPTTSSPKTNGPKPRALRQLSPSGILHPLSYPASGVAPCRAIKRRKGIRHPKVAFLITVLSLTAVLGQRFYNQPGLQVGSVSAETIVAPKDARVEDTQTTEERRRDARNGSLPILKIDATTNETVYRSLESLLEQVNTIRREAGAFPYLPTSSLSTQVQHYLRQADNASWLKILGLVETIGNFQATTDQGAFDTLLRSEDLTPDEQKVVSEFWSYQQRATPQEFERLLTQVKEAHQNYQTARANLALLASQVDGLVDTPILFELSSRSWSDAQINMRRAVERILAQGIPPGLPPEVLNRAVAAQLKGTLPRQLEDFSQQILLAVLQPNLVEDPDRTQIQAEMAAEAVKPVIVEVQQGDLIVQEGEPISQSQFVLLDHFNLSQRRFNYWGIAGFGAMVGSGVMVFLLLEKWSSHNLRQQDYLLITAMVVSSAGLNVVGAAAYGLPAVGLLAGSFYGPLLGGTLVALIAVLLPVGASVTGVSFAAGAVGAFVCSILAGRMRSREELALLGGGVGLTQGVGYLALTVMLSPVSISAWSGVLAGAALQGAYGVISSIAALGLSPYLEHLFDLVTPIRLAELANPNRPMLKRLASEAPGTFQHTLFVSSLAEAAAQALGCNVELVRAGTLYHDIGKMHDPLGFIENQMGGPNKHDELNDPWLSASIIKKHVTQGLVMARKCRLPKAIRAFIPEHQGSMLISYFYHQAKEMAEKDPTITIKEEDFRYDGPIPQSPETGIVMLADSCEAALRSLTDATPDEALAMVNRILRARWKDDQLVESGLTREHMSVIADIFVRVWQQYNHKRIAYPKAALAPKPAV
jgi:putative nucleotidyltransferase with HDIG domain